MQNSPLGGEWVHREVVAGLPGAAGDAEQHKALQVPAGDHDQREPDRRDPRTGRLLDRRRRIGARSGRTALRVHATGHTAPVETVPRHAVARRPAAAASVGFEAITQESKVN